MLAKLSTISVSPHVQAFIAKESQEKLPNETGGVLIGSVEGERVAIHCATPPGPSASHTLNSFKRDGIYSQRALDLLVARYRGRYDYLGEWHSHPLPQGPSQRDLRSMRWIAGNESYRRNQPILGLNVRRCDASWQLQFYVLVADHLRPLRLEHNSLSQQSKLLHGRKYD